MFKTPVSESKSHSISSPAAPLTFKALAILGEIDKCENKINALEEELTKGSSEIQKMKELKAAGKEKTATYRQYFGNRMLYKMMLDKYKEYGLLD